LTRHFLIVLVPFYPLSATQQKNQFDQKRKRKTEREGERERGRELIINVCSAGLVLIQSLAPYIEYWHLKFPTPHFKTCETSGI
jgi:uncharacterized membrane protein